MPFNKNVTMTKRNHIYFGATQSEKIAVTLKEAYVDLENIYDSFNKQEIEFQALASGYLDPSGSLKDLSSQISELEKSFEMTTYIHATQDPIY